jgi:hypothetical protein
MREPWSTEECPGGIKIDYKKLIIDENIKKQNNMMVHLFIFRGEVDIFVHSFTSKN